MKKLSRGYFSLVEGSETSTQLSSNLIQSTQFNNTICLKKPDSEPKGDLSQAVLAQMKQALENPDYIAALPRPTPNPKVSETSNST